MIIYFSIHWVRVRSMLTSILKIRVIIRVIILCLFTRVSYWQNTLPQMVKPIYSDVKKSCGSVIMLLFVFDLKISRRENCLRQLIVVSVKYSPPFYVSHRCIRGTLVIKYKPKPKFQNFQKYLKFAGCCLKTIQILWFILIFSGLKAKCQILIFQKTSHEELNTEVHAHEQRTWKKLDLNLVRILISFFYWSDCLISVSLYVIILLRVNFLPWF